MEFCFYQSAFVCFVNQSVHLLVGFLSSLQSHKLVPPKCSREGEGQRGDVISAIDSILWLPFTSLIQSALPQPCWSTKLLFEKGISWTTRCSQHCLEMHLGHIKGTVKSSIGRNYFNAFRRMLLWCTWWPCRVGKIMPILYTRTLRLILVPWPRSPS